MRLGRIQRSPGVCVGVHCWRIGGILIADTSWGNHAAERTRDQKSKIPIQAVQVNRRTRPLPSSDAGRWKAVEMEVSLRAKREIDVAGAVPRCAASQGSGTALRGPEIAGERNRSHGCPQGEERRVQSRNRAFVQSDRSPMVGTLENREEPTSCGRSQAKDGSRCVSPDRCASAI